MGCPVDLPFGINQEDIRDSSARIVTLASSDTFRKGNSVKEMNSQPGTGCFDLLLNLLALGQTTLRSVQDRINIRRRNHRSSLLKADREPLMIRSHGLRPAFSRTCFAIRKATRFSCHSIHSFTQQPCPSNTNQRSNIIRPLDPMHDLLKGNGAVIQDMAEHFCSIRISKNIHAVMSERNLQRMPSDSIRHSSRSTIRCSHTHRLGKIQRDNKDSAFALSFEGESMEFLREGIRESRALASVRSTQHLSKVPLHHSATHLSSPILTMLSLNCSNCSWISSINPFAV